ncbi:viperin family antiviral radical SAM protein [Coraliomargarita sp. W4R53]
MLSSSSLPETVNYHYTAACEMACEHCFAVFKDCSSSQMKSHKAVIRAIAEAPLAPGMYLPRRLNFVGGEPTLHRSFPELLEYALECGLRVSIVTNGYSLVKKGLPQQFHQLDLIGLSVDSLNHETNIRIGRSVRGETISEQEWYRLFDELQQAGVALKINTTITRHNADEDLSRFILNSRPERWKIFQAMPVEGQNCGNKDRWLVDRATYDQFVARHVAAGAYSEAEPESLMRGSYAMIAPNGRFFDSALGSHTYSSPIPEVGVSQAWQQVHFDAERFEERTKNYSELTSESSRLIAS